MISIWRHPHRNSFRYDGQGFCAPGERASVLLPDHPEVYLRRNRMPHPGSIFLARISSTPDFLLIGGSHARLSSRPPSVPVQVLQGILHNYLSPV